MDDNFENECHTQGGYVMNRISDTQQKLSIFLSHSHKDIEKVRKLRDILEFLDCEPLMFYLKCLDEDNDELNEFIMREIEARNIFIYCKSKNSEQSSWVKKELDYIRKLDSKRLYTVDIDQQLAYGMLGILEKITNIIKKNQVFISYSARNGKDIAQRLCHLLQERGYNAYLAVDKLTVGSDYDKSILGMLTEVAENGVFIPVITAGYSDSVWCKKELEYVLAHKGTVLPVVVKSTAISPTLHFYLRDCQFIEIDESISEEAIARIDRALAFL